MTPNTHCSHYKVCKDMVAYLKQFNPSISGFMKCESAVSIANDDNCPHDTRAHPASPDELDKIIPLLEEAIQIDVSDNCFVWLEDLESVIATLRQQKPDERDTQ